MPSQAVADALTRVQNTKLKAQTGAMAAKTQAMGGSVKKGGPSILSRIFDVISRPLYGVSEGIARASEAKNPEEIGKGIIGGLAGKNKTDISDALVRGAEHTPNSLLSKAIRENKYNLRNIAGLTGDVLLDPTTYIGAGLVKDVGEGTLKAAKLAGIAEHFAKPEVLKGIEEAGQAARGAKEAKFAAKGAAKATEAIPKGASNAEIYARITGKSVDEAKAVEESTKVAADTAKKERALASAEKKGAGTARRAAYPEAKAAGQAAADALRAENAGGKVVLKFAGKTVGESQKAYEAASKVGKAITSTKLGATANKAFRTAAVFPELTNVIKREAQLRGLAKAEQETRASLSFLKGFKPHELELVTHAAEAGPIKNPITDEVAASSLHGLKSESGKDLGEAVDHMREVLDTRLKHETDVGVHVDKETGRPLTFEEARKENYVPHYFKNASTEEEALKKARKAIGPDRPGFTMPQKLESLAHAKSVGLEPEVQADRILARRIAASHKGIARAEFSKSVAEHYGVDMAGNEGRKLFHGKEGQKRLAELGYKSVDNPYVPKTMLFPSHIAESFKAMEAAHSSDKIAQEFLKHFDKIQNEWKFWNTAANPGHHIRNMVGDAWNNFVLGGVKNPERYKQAGQLVYGDPEKFAMKVGEKTLSGRDVLRHQIESGAKPAFTMGELATGGDKSFMQGIKGKVADVAEKRENFTRTANFIEQFKKEGAKLGSDATEAEIKAAASRAGERVRHINIDFGDLTDFEKTKMKRAIPFYTWSRKNLPLQIEALAMHPGRVASIPKGTAAIQRLLGTDNGYNANPLDTIPKWLKEMSTIQLGRAGSGKDASFLNPALPFSDIGKFTEGGKQGILRNLVSQTNPLIRIPAEQAFGQKAFSGAPVGTNVEYAASQISPLNQIYKLLTGKQKVMSPQTLNYLTGAGVQKVTPTQVSAELRRQQVPMKASQRKAKKKLTGG